MKSILMIAYFFPPEGNAGVYRPLRFARSLATLGWDIRVISADPYAYERFDPALLKSIPSGIEIIPVRGCDWWQAILARKGKKEKAVLSQATIEQTQKIHSAQHAPFRSRIRNAVRKMEAAYYIPDLAMPWIRPAFRKAVVTCLAKRPDVIWATVGPISSGVVAFQVSQQIHVPYVLDFRDPWGLDYGPTDLIRPKFATRRVRSIMSQIFERAQAIVFLFDAVAECYLQAYPGVINEKKIHIIPNGYEGSLDDFLAPSGNKCQILYTGTLSTYRYDTLLQALVILKKTYPAQASQLLLQFVGEGVRELQTKIEALSLSEMIKTMPTTSHGEIRRLQQEAHVFLILGRPAGRKGHKLVAGAKLFEYLKARKPILGVLPRDETRKVLDHVGVSTLADVDSIPAIIAAFQQIIDAWDKGTLETLLPDCVACNRYSAETQTKALIHALEGDMAERPFHSDVVQVPLSLAREIGQRK